MGDHLHLRYSVGYNTLTDCDDVTGDAEYIVAQNRKSHRFVDISEPRVTGPFETAKELISALAEGLKWYDSQPIRGRPIAHAATQWFFRFGKGTKLTPEERARVDRVVSATLEVGYGSISACHVHRLNGSCDFHYIVPSLVWTPLPTARPRTATNTCRLLLRGVARLVAEFNETRLEFGLPRIGFTSKKPQEVEKQPEPKLPDPGDWESFDWVPMDDLPPIKPKKKPYPKPGLNPGI